MLLELDLALGFLLGVFMSCSSDTTAGGSMPEIRDLLVHFSAQLERFVWDRGCA
jgi:hypothetical protein